MRSFIIMVDSSCDLPEEYINEHGIVVLPMLFSLDSTDYPKGYWQDISAVDFYNALRTGGVAKTTQVNPGIWAEQFKKYAEQGKDIIAIVLSSGLSGSYDNSVAAAAEVRESYPGAGIYTVDSTTATAGHGLLTMLAVQKGEEGLTAAETFEWIENKKKSLFALFTVDDLHFLHRGGRLSMLSAVAGSILSVKPLLNISPDGTLKLKDKVRGRKAALETLVNQIKRCIDPGTELNTMLISHCDCEADANKLAEMVKAAVSVRNMVVMYMGPVIGAHTGPGAIAIFVEGDILRTEYEDKYYPVKK